MKTGAEEKSRKSKKQKYMMDIAMSSKRQYLIKIKPCRMFLNEKR